MIKINPTSADFMERLEKEYKSTLVMPCKDTNQLINSIRTVFSLEPVSIEEAISELKNFILTKKIDVEKSEAFLLTHNKDTEVFYSYYTSRFQMKEKIFLIVDKGSDAIVSNCELFRIKIKILRGINKEDVERKTREYKAYLNLFYLYDSSLGIHC